MIDNNELRLLQLIELDILKNVVEICDKNNIKYYLIGGTLLGAVRHKGFIPWDDDIDIAMMRKDYDRFIQVCQNSLSANLFLQNKETDERISVAFTKIRKNGTKFIEKETINSDMHKGIFIDIFPLDNIPEKDSIVLEIEYLIFIFLQAISLYKNNYRDYKSKTVKMISAIFSFIPFSIINKVSNKIMTRHNKKETDYVTSYASGYGYKKQRMKKKEIYGDGVKLLFEDREYIVPSQYTKYLAHLYGDYMQLPPIEKRGNQHRVIEIDLGRVGNTN